MAEGVVLGEVILEIRQQLGELLGEVVRGGLAAIAKAAARFTAVVVLPTPPF